MHWQSKSYTSWTLAIAVLMSNEVRSCYFWCKPNVSANLWRFVRYFTRGVPSLIILKHPVEESTTKTGFFSAKTPVGWTNWPLLPSLVPLPFPESVLHSPVEDSHILRTYILVANIREKNFPIVFCEAVYSWAAARAVFYNLLKFLVTKINSKDPPFITM